MQAEPNFIKQKLHQSNRASSGFMQTIIMQQVCICIATFSHGLPPFSFTAYDQQIKDTNYHQVAH